MPSWAVTTMVIAVCPTGITKLWGMPEMSDVTALAVTVFPAAKVAVTLTEVSVMSTRSVYAVVAEPKTGASVPADTLKFAIVASALRGAACLVTVIV